MPTRSRTWPLAVKFRLLVALPDERVRVADEPLGHPLSCLSVLSVRPDGGLQDRDSLVSFDARMKRTSSVVGSGEVMPGVGPLVPWPVVVVICQTGASSPASLLVMM